MNHKCDSFLGHFADSTASGHKQPKMNEYIINAPTFSLYTKCLWPCKLVPRKALYVNAVPSIVYHSYDMIV